MGVAVDRVKGQGLLGQLPENARNARVRILDVVHRVVIRLRFRDIEIEVEVLVVGAHHVIEARGVITDFLAQLAQRVELAAAGPHLYALAAAIQRHELDELHLEVIRFVTHRLQSCANTRHVTVVVGAQDVNQVIIPAFALVEVIGDVGGEVGLDAVVAHDDAILVVPELR